MANATEPTSVIPQHTDPRWPSALLSSENHDSIYQSSFSAPYTRPFLPQTTPQQHNNYRQQTYQYPGYLPDALTFPDGRSSSVNHRESSSNLTPPSTSSSPAANEIKTAFSGEQSSEEASTSENQNSKHLEAVLWMRNKLASFDSGTVGSGNNITGNTSYYDKQQEGVGDRILQYTKEALLGLRYEKDRQTPDARYWHQQRIAHENSFGSVQPQQQINSEQPPQQQWSEYPRISKLEDETLLKPSNSLTSPEVNGQASSSSPTVKYRMNPSPCEETPFVETPATRSYADTAKTCYDMAGAHGYLGEYAGTGAYFEDPHRAHQGYEVQGEGQDEDDCSPDAFPGNSAYHSAAAMAAAAVVAQAAADSASAKQHPAGFVSPNGSVRTVNGMSSGRIAKGKKLSITGKSLRVDWH